MKLYAKKFLLYGLCALTVASSPIYAATTTTSTVAQENTDATDSKPILTLEDAIKAATTHNNSLGLKTQQDKVYDEQLKYSEDLSTLSYQTLYTSKLQNEQQKQFLKDKIAYDITSDYYSIILAEQELTNLDADIALKENELNTLALKLDLGVVSSLDYDAEKVALAKLESSKATKLETLSSLKENFKDITNKDLNNYSLDADFTLEKSDDLSTNPNGYIKSIVGTYLQYSKELAEINLNHLWDNFAYSDTAPTVAEYEQLKYTAASTSSQVKDSEDTLVQNLNTMYSNLTNLEEQINILQPQVDLLEKQVSTAKLQYDLGLISKLDYDSTCSKQKDMDYSLNSLIYQYNSLSEQIQKPWVIS